MSLTDHCAVPITPQDLVTLLTEQVTRVQPQLTDLQSKSAELHSTVLSNRGMYTLTDTTHMKSQMQKAPGGVQPKSVED